MNAEITRQIPQEVRQGRASWTDLVRGRKETHEFPVFRVPRHAGACDQRQALSIHAPERTQMGIPKHGKIAATYHFTIMQKIILFLALAVAVAATAATVTPPAYNPEVQCLVLDASESVTGTRPFTYQWYRGTATDLLKVKIPAPEGVQPQLTLRANSTAGLYSCVVTNSAGSVQIPPTQLSLTTSKTAVGVKVTMKKGAQ